MIVFAAHANPSAPSLPRAGSNAAMNSAPGRTNATSDPNVAPTTSNASWSERRRTAHAATSAWSAKSAAAKTQRGGGEGVSTDAGRWASLSLDSNLRVERFVEIFFVEIFFVEIFFVVRLLVVRLLVHERRDESFVRRLTRERRSSPLASSSARPNLREAKPAREDERVASSRREARTPPVDISAR